jgi:hypothetical protein
MVKAATPLPPPPPPPPRVGVPAPALAAPTAEESAVKALEAAVHFACLRFMQRPHSDGGPQWLRLSGLLELIAPPASESRPGGACVHPVPSAVLETRLGKLRAEMTGFLRKPRGEPATKAAVVPHLDDYEARRKWLIAALGAAAERWTPPTRCRGSAGDSALPPPLPVLRRVMLASSGPAPDDEQVTFEAAAMEEEAFEEEEEVEDEAAEDEAELEKAVVEARPAEDAAAEVDDERASVVAEDEASETDYMEEQQPQMPSPPPPSPVLPPPPPPSPVANDKRRAASGDLATSLDGAAWQLGASQQQGAGDEKRQRTSPKFFLAGAAPPPSALYAARCAQACAEQPRQEMAALSPPESTEVEAVEEAMEAEETEQVAVEHPARDPATPRPQLLGTQVRVLWGDEWYQGVGGDSKLGGGEGVWITRVAYDASGTWRKCSMWHDLANETWELM